MLNSKIADLLNEQVNKEFYSAYLYLDFANYYADAGLDGFANWYQVQAQEERDHAMMMRRYLLDNGDKVVFQAIAGPDKSFADNTAPLKAGLEHERFVTASINEIYAQYFGDHKPARSCFAVAHLPKDALVEIEAIAVR